MWPGLVLKHTPTIPRAVTETLSDTSTHSNDEIDATSTSGPGRELFLNRTLEESRAGSDSPSEPRGQSRQDNSQDSAEAVTENAQTSNGLHGVSTAGHASPDSLREDSQGGLWSFHTYCLYHQEYVKRVNKSQYHIPVPSP